MKKLKIEKGYIKEHIAPVADYSENHINLIKLVEKVENGIEVAENLERNKNGFNFEGVKKGDIIKAVRYNRENKSAETLYYFVINITDTQLTLSEGFNTYSKVNNALNDLKKDIKQLKEILDRLKSIFDIDDMSRLVGVA